MNIKKTTVLATICLVVISLAAYYYLHNNRKEKSVPLPAQNQSAQKQSVKKIDQILHEPVIAPSVINIVSDDALRNLLQNNEEPSVLFFHRDGCGWCKKMQPIFEETVHNKNFAAIKFYSVNAADLQVVTIVKDILHEKISVYPTLFFMDQKKVINKQIGFEDLQGFEKNIQKNFKNIVSDNTSDKSVKNNDQRNVVENDSQNVVIQKTCGAVSGCGCCCGWVCGDACSCKCGGDGCSCNSCPCDGNGCPCSSNSKCDSGNCYLGLCEACESTGIACNNNGNCCSSMCINGFCSCGTANNCGCESNTDCDSGNCYSGICQPCVAVHGPCSNDGQCCSGNSCMNGFCDGPVCIAALPGVDECVGGGTPCCPGAMCMNIDGVVVTPGTPGNCVGPDEPEAAVSSKSNSQIKGA